MAELDKCPEIWKNPANKLPVQVVKFNEVNIQFTAMMIGSTGIFIMCIVFVYGDRGPTVAKAIYYGNKSSKYALLLCLKPLVLHFLPETIDSVTDILYFFKLESLKTLVGPGVGIIITMVIVLCLTLVKDFYCTKWFVDGYFWYWRHDEHEIEDEDSAREKVNKLMLSAIVEDIPQVLLQYFVFEKTMLEVDLFVYVNGLLMMVSAILFILAIRKPVDVRVLLYIFYLIKKTTLYF